MMFAFDRLSGMPTLDALPIRMEQTNSRSSTVFRLVLLSPALVLLAVPMLVGAHVAGGPSTRAIAAEQPFAVAQVLLGFVLWAGLLAIPVTQALARLGATRRIAIDRQSVTVEETRLGSRQVWRVPLSEYRGIAHHVRTSVSGARHELVLVHADPRRHVLLVTGDRIAQSTLDKAKVLLGLPELPARAIYERRHAAGPTVEPQMDLAAARA